jgi:hypothetical protein
MKIQTSPPTFSKNGFKKYSIEIAPPIMEIHKYETKFIKGVIETYSMLSKLDEVQNDLEFWKVFGKIKVRFNEIDTAVKNYYAELRKCGGDTKNCSLAYELNYGIYDIDDKYWAIRDKISEISAILK